MGSYLWLVFLGSIVGLCLNWLIASEFYAVVEKKGYEDRKYFWYCFFFGVVGYLLVIALPDRDKRHVVRTAYVPAPPATAPVHYPAPVAPQAAAPQVPTPAQANGDFWICPACHTKNLNSRQTCWSCNAPKP